jgi:hypothetical protein
VDVRGGYRPDLAEQAVERIPEDTAGAPLETRRVDEVRRADLAHVHLQVGVLPNQGTRSTGVVRMDVGEQHVAKIGELEPVPGEAGLEAWDAGRRPAVDDGRLGALEQVDSGRAWPP